MPVQQIKLRRDTAANWTSVNPVLAQGEPGFETDTGLLKIGNGTDVWDDLEGISGAGGGGGFQIGAIFPHGGTVAPIGALICDGSAISRTDYSDLFAAIGTTWGAGDGSTTFNLPDLQGAFLRGTGSHGTETMADGNPFAGPAVGAFEDDQMQGHHHGLLINSSFGADLTLQYIGVNSTRSASTNNANLSVGDPATDGTNGTPRTGDETRPFAAGVTYCIQATSQSNSGTPLPTYSYSTEFAVTNWQNYDAVISHGLNADMGDLMFVVDVSPDNGTTWYRPENTAYDYGTSTNIALALEGIAIDSSSFKIQTGSNGVAYVDDSGARLALGASVPDGRMRIKVYRPEVLATELATTKYDTGWVANSDWTNAEFTITHNLGADLSGLITEFFISTDGTGAGTIQINSADLWKNGTTASAEGRGVSYIAISQNSFKVQTASNGIALVIDSGSVDALDTEAWYYRVVVYKPELISTYSAPAVKSVSADYTITGSDDSHVIQATTGASDITVTLPAGSGLTPGEEFEISKEDSGTGKVILSRAGSDTIDGVTSVDIDSRYDLAVVRWTGSYWRLVEYKDHGIVSGDEWTRYVDGSIVIKLSDIYSNITTASGNIFGLSSEQTVTFPTGVTIDASLRRSAIAADSSSSVIWGIVGSINSTSVAYEMYSPLSIAGSRTAFITVSGRWRA